IMGTTSEVENIPAPPIMESPRAPVLGRYSETKPNIVGQKKQTPSAKTKAAPNAASPLTILNKINPIPANNDENINIPFGFIRCTTGPANERPKAIKPLINTSTNIAETLAPCNKETIQVLVPSSVAPVIIIQITIMINRGCKHAEN